VPRRHCDRAGLMMPNRMHANGVPWLIWVRDSTWECRGCGGSGRQPHFTVTLEFARWVGDLKREHAGCGEHALVPDGSIGDPLNRERWDR
jgi:hypothetical protein